MRSAVLLFLVAALLGVASAQKIMAEYDWQVSKSARLFFRLHAMNYTYTASVIPAAGVNATLVSVTVYRQSVVNVTMLSSADATTQRLVFAAVESIDTMFNNIQANVSAAAPPSGVRADFYTYFFDQYSGYPKRYVGDVMTRYPQIDVYKMSLITTDPVRYALRRYLQANSDQFDTWRDYSYLQQEVCLLCSVTDPKNPSRSSPVLVTIRDSEVSSVTDTFTGKAIDSGSFITMWDWLLIAYQAVDRSPIDSLKVSYDATTGCLATFQYRDWFNATTRTFYFADCSPALHPDGPWDLWVIITVAALSVAALLGCIGGFVVWKRYKCRGGRKVASQRGDCDTEKTCQNGDAEMSGFNAGQTA